MSYCLRFSAFGLLSDATRCFGRPIENFVTPRQTDRSEKCTKRSLIPTKNVVGRLHGPCGSMRRRLCRIPQSIMHRQGIMWSELCWENTTASVGKTYHAYRLARTPRFCLKPKLATTHAVRVENVLMNWQSLSHDHRTVWTGAMIEPDTDHVRFQFEFTAAGNPSDDTYIFDFCRMPSRCICNA